MAKSYKVTVVNCYYLNVRKSANANSLIVAVVNKGNSFTASKYSNGWYYVSAKGGWMSGKYLSVKATTPAKNTSSSSSKKQTAAQKKAAAEKAKYQKGLEAAKKKYTKDVVTKQLKNASKASLYHANIQQNEGIINPHKVKTSIGSDITGYSEMTSDYSDETLMFNGTNEEPSSGNLLRTLSVRSSSNRLVYYNGYYDRVQGTSSLTKTGFADPDRSFKEPITVDDSMSAHDERVMVLHNNDVMSDSSYKKLHTMINRFKTPMPDYALSKTTAYVFFTRPTLNLFDDTGGMNLRNEIAQDPLFSYMFAENADAVRSLSSRLSSEHGFNPFLSNTAESFELQDDVIKTIEHGETYTGWKNVYARNTIESNSAGQISISFTDDRRLTVYKMHKLWLEYMTKIQKGIFTSTRTAIQQKVLDYACSIYYFLCSGDGESILMWSKYIGAFPLNAPSSAYSWTKGSAVANPKFNINYMYAMKEDMNPIALSEFNYLTKDMDKGSYIPIYSPLEGKVMPSMAGMPYIETEEGYADNLIYKLRFRES